MHPKMFPSLIIEIEIGYNVIEIILIIIRSLTSNEWKKSLMSCLILMLDNNKLFETILCINDEEHGEIIIINLQFISKPVLTANGNIDYKNITHSYSSTSLLLM